MSSLLLCLRVLARELRRESFQPLFLPLQPRLARPSALQIVADLYVQPAQRLGFELDQVAVLERVQAAVIGAQASTSPGSSGWIELTHSMQRGILCAMSLVL